MKEKMNTNSPAKQWRWWLLVIGLPILLVGFAANHIEYHYRQKNLQSSPTASLKVRVENSSFGHNQIGIDESSISQVQEQVFLTFAMLGGWVFDPQKPSACPENITALNGHDVSAVGFMYPLEAGTKVRLFCLLRTTQTCCYGPRPQYNQYIFVELKEPVKFERFAPIMVTGKFFVDPQPEQGYIYRMEGSSVVLAVADEPEIDAAQVALKAKVPLFNFATLEETENQKPSTPIPEALIALDGKSVVMEGFILHRKEGLSPHFTIAKNWWDGKAQGKPPTIYNAAMMHLQSPQEMPPVWKQKDVFMGILKVNRNQLSWPTEGIVNIYGATRVGSIREKSGMGLNLGPFIPVHYEIIISVAFLFLVIVLRVQDRLQTNSTRRLKEGN